MKIRNYSELTDFIYDEYSKMSENFGMQQPSSSFLKFNEATLQKYIKLYDKPLYKKAKRDLKLQEAFDTMPHGAIWKFFHADLWARMQYTMAQEKKQLQRDDEESTQSTSKILVPTSVEWDLSTNENMNVDNSVEDEE